MKFLDRFKIAKKLRDDPKAAQAYDRAMMFELLAEIEQKMFDLTAKRAALRDEQKALQSQYDALREQIKQMGVV